MKNKKTKLILLVLLGIFFSSFAIGFVKGDITYTTIEEIEDFSCTDDTFVSENHPSTNYGNLTFWHVNYTSMYNRNYSLFKFDLSNKPEGAFDCEGIIYIDDLFSLMDYGFFVVLLMPNLWSEDTVTWNTRPLPSIEYYLPYRTIVNVSDLEKVKFRLYINLNEYMEEDFISFALCYLETSISGYTKESLLKPRLLWTIEVEHTIERPSNLVENILFGLLGLSIGAFGVAIPLIIKLRKRNE